MSFFYGIMCSEPNHVISHPNIIPEALNIQGFCQHDAYTWKLWFNFRISWSIWVDFLAGHDRRRRLAHERMVDTRFKTFCRCHLLSSRGPGWQTGLQDNSKPYFQTVGREQRQVDAAGKYHYKGHTATHRRNARAEWDRGHAKCRMHQQAF